MILGNEKILLFLCLLLNKTLKCMQSTVFGTSKQHYTKLLLCFFCFLCTKKLQRVENTTYGKTEQQQNHVFFFFHKVRKQNPKRHANHLIWGKEMILTETHFFYYYYYIRHQMLKKKNRGKHSIWKNKNA